MLDKMAKIQMLDQVFNWIKDFFDDHTHCTKYTDELSTFASIRDSVIQGSGLGPASCLLTADDLRPVHECNSIVKYADDTYLIVPAANCDTCTAEFDHIVDWAEKNNLRLNCAKTKEIVVRPRMESRLRQIWIAKPSSPVWLVRATSIA